MKRAILCLFVLVYAYPAAAETGFQFAAPNVRVPDDPDVNGCRISLLYGDNRSVSGVDIGFVALSKTEKLSGLGLALGFGQVTREMSGGAALSLVNVHTGRDKGVNAAFVNRLNAADEAVNIGFINVADGATMVDVGGLNVSSRSNTQLGFINITKEIKSFQLGFINAAENGFFPVFPFFNFPK